MIGRAATCNMVFSDPAISSTSLRASCQQGSQVQLLAFSRVSSPFLHLCLIVFRVFILVGSRICVRLPWSSLRDVTSKALTAFYFATGTGPNWNMRKCQTLQPSVYMVRNTTYRNLRVFVTHPFS